MFIRNWGTLTPPCPIMGCENASTRDRGRRCCSSQMPCCHGRDRAKGTRERHLTRGAMDSLRKADDRWRNGFLFSSTVGVAMQRVVPCSCLVRLKGGILVHHLKRKDRTGHVEYW